MSAMANSTLPLQAAGKRSTFFETEALDHVVAMMVEMTAEMWVTRERLFALEAVLSERDPSLREAVEAWEPDARQAGKLEAMRQAMLHEVFRTLGIPRSGPDEDAIAAMDDAG